MVHGQFFGTQWLQDGIVAYGSTEPRFVYMGDAPVPAINTSTQLSVGITPTQTIVQMQAGPVNVTMNFLSPITVRPNQPSFDLHLLILSTQATDLD